MVIRAKKKNEAHTFTLLFFFNLRYKLRRKGRTARILLLLSPVTLNEIL